MAYAICRVAKLKSAAAIRGAVGHNARSRPTPNADPRRQNRVLVDPGEDPYATVQRRIEAAGVKPRANAVLAMEMLLSASPEHFRPTAPDRAGTWDPDRTRDWYRATRDWLRDTYGDRVVSAHLHLDESTPHVQAVIVPLTPDGRLSAREMFGKAELRGLQRGAGSYAEALEHLGIEPGIEGSTAKHERVRAFYGAAAAAEPAEIPKITASPVPTPPLAGREAWAEEQTRVKRAEAVANRRAAQKAARTMGDQAAAGVLAERRRQGAAGTARRATRERDEARQAQRAMTDAMRDVPLSDVLVAAGLERDPSDQHQWIGLGHRITVDGARWYDHAAGRGRGGAIDLTMHLTGEDFAGSVGWLRDRFGAEPIVAAVRAYAAEVVRSAPEPRPFQPPEPAPRMLDRVRRYLTQARGIGTALVDRLIRQGDVYGDTRGNVVALCRGAGGPSGAELKGTDPERPFTGMAKGSHRKDGHFTVGMGDGAGLQRLVIVESAIDAMSYAELAQVPPGERWAALSTAGVRTELPSLDGLMADGVDVVVAYDADAAGDAAAARLMERHPGLRRERPAQGKDWNDVLQAPTDFEDLDQGQEQGL